MEPAELYHRTYLPDGPFARVCNEGCHEVGPGAQRGANGKLRFDPALMELARSSQPQLPGPFSNLPANPLPTKREPYNPAQRRIQAYRFTGGTLAEIFIVEKLDQHFHKYATGFEQHFSRLVDKNKRFEPVVDNLTVVGHVGRVNGLQLVAPMRGWLPQSVNETLEMGLPLYVAPPGFQSDEWRPLAASEVLFTVLTGIDGEVIAGLGTDYVGIESVDFWLLDAVFVGKGLATLGITLGKGLMKSLTRRVGKRAANAFRGPTREIAEEAMERLAVKQVPTSGGSAFIPQTGMTQGHFGAFKAAAKEADVIAVVRNTNPASAKLIEKGCPGKPLHFKFHTSDRTGVVMAETADDIRKAHQHGYFIVDPDGVARRTVIRNGKEAVEEMRLQNPFWQLEKGQVIDPKLKKPVVGDYDLMGVIDPKAPGRNIALHASKGKTPDDISSPIVDRFAGVVNSKMDMPRVLHGAQDQFAGFRKGATAFLPDGTVKYLPDEAAVKQFYESIGRETIKGAYGRPGPGVPVVDELAARRAGR
jgi:hypothetical protein